MNEYEIVYLCKDGTEGVERVYAVNRMMAFEVFEGFGVEDVVDVNCSRIFEK